MWVSRKEHRRRGDPEDEYHPNGDGLKFPVAISGFALLGVVFGGGGLYVRDQNQSELIKELRTEIRESVKSQVSGERIARCESDIASLNRDIAELKEMDKSLWRYRGRPEVGG